MLCEQGLQECPLPPHRETQLSYPQRAALKEREPPKASLPTMSPTTAHGTEGLRGGGEGGHVARQPAAVLQLPW